jgi:hypothetical protein
VVRYYDYAIAIAAAVEHIASHRFYTQEVEVVVGDPGGDGEIVAVWQADLWTHPALRQGTLPDARTAGHGLVFDPSQIVDALLAVARVEPLQARGFAHRKTAQFERIQEAEAHCAETDGQSQGQDGQRRDSRPPG